MSGCLSHTVFHSMEYEQSIHCERYASLDFQDRKKSHFTNCLLDLK